MTKNKARCIRVLETAALAAGASLFLVYGVVALLNGGGLLAVGFIAVGLIGGIGAATYGFFGARLGVEIVGENLVVRHYFTERIVPLARVKRLYRSVDATVLETTEGNVVIDDSIFSDPATRKALFGSLENLLQERMRT